MKTPTINAQHEYITVNFGNGRRLTASYRGEKAAGAVPLTVFQAWTALVTSTTDTRPLRARIEEFVRDIDQIWPTWNEPARTFAVGAHITVDFGARRGGLDQGTIEAKRGTSYTVRFKRHGLITMQGDLLDQMSR